MVDTASFGLEKDFDIKFVSRVGFVKDLELKVLSLTTKNYFEFEFAGTFTTNYISVLNDIQLYAVPARNNVTLKLPFKLDSKKDIKLFDSKGNLVTLDEINIKQKANEYYFDLSFPKGKYFMSIKNKNSTYIKSFLVN